DVPQREHAAHDGDDDRQVGDVVQLVERRQAQDRQDREGDGEQRQDAAEARVRVDRRWRAVADVAERHALAEREVARADAGLQEVEREQREEDEQRADAGDDQADGRREAAGLRGVAVPRLAVGLAVAGLRAPLAAAGLPVALLLPVGLLLAVRLLRLPAGGPPLTGGLLLRLLRLLRLLLGAPALARLLLRLVVGVGGGRRALPLGVVDAALARRIRHVLGPPRSVVVSLGEASGRVRIPAGTDLGHRCCSSAMRVPPKGRTLAAVSCVTRRSPPGGTC